jgi:EAL domain-containing protein (putative c-di-GMP-specific phosphodiesterase class I)/GGDEF domain-containing protein
MAAFDRSAGTGRVTSGNSMNGAEPGTRVSPSIRFIEQFLKQRSESRLKGLLLGQLDAFNRISTTFGHAKSASFCSGYTDTLRHLLPPGTPIIRLSARRFAILLPLDSITTVMDAAASIADEHQPHLQVGDDTFLVDVTLGVAVYPTHADDAASLFRRAELALNDARENELAFDLYRPEATQQQATLWKLESDLDKAISSGGLDVHYQPQIEVASNKVVGLEALVRWRTAGGRFVPPDEFIPLAERSGSIVALTWLVFERVQTCAQQLAALGAPFSVAINIAPQVLIHGEFYPRLTALKQSLEASCVRLAIELTEDSLLHSDSLTVGALEKLRQLDVSLAIDDFGKGYSSLSYLKEIPATEIKIDKRFIGTLSIDRKDREIVKAVVDIAHALGMKVVAEGVDSAESLAAVRELGCEMAQGFFLGRPMRAEHVVDWVLSYGTACGLTHSTTRRAMQL